MVKLLRTTCDRWRRRRRAARLRRNLHALGYTPAELEKMASLSAMYQDDEQTRCRYHEPPPHVPALKDVLDCWAC